MRREGPSRIRSEEIRRKLGSMIACSEKFCRNRASVLAKASLNQEIEKMKTVTYPLEIDEAIFQRVEMEARRRDRTTGEVCRDLIVRGLMQLSQQSTSDFESVIADTWEKIGPAPDIDYDKL